MQGGGKRELLAHVQLDEQPGDARCVIHDAPRKTVNFLMDGFGNTDFALIIRQFKHPVPQDPRG
jgi:hypothetical protein